MFKVTIHWVWLWSLFVFFCLTSVHAEPWLYSRKSDSFFYSSSRGVFLYWGKAFFGKKLNVYRRAKGRKAFKKINKNVIKLVSNIPEAKKVLGRDYKVFARDHSNKEIMNAFRSSKHFVKRVKPKQLKMLDLHTRLLGLSFLDKNVRLNRTYEYQLRNQSGTVYTKFTVFHGKIKSFRKQVSFQNLRVEITDGFIEIKWKPLVNALNVLGYNIFRREKASSSKKAGKVVKVNEDLVKAKYHTFVYFFDPKAVKDKLVEYSIQAIDFWGRKGPLSKFRTSPILHSDVKTSIFPKPTEVIVPSVRLPLPPKKIEITMEKKGVLLKWDYDPKASLGRMFEIQRKKNNSDYRVLKFIDVKKNDEYLDTTVVGRALYSYRIQAIADSGLRSKFSSTVKIGTKPIRLPQRIIAFNGVVKKNKVCLQWKEPPDALLNGYVLYRSDNVSDNFNKIKEFDDHQTEYCDKNVKPKIKYYYAIATKNGVGESKLSRAFSVTLKLPYPSRVTVLKGEYDPSANVVELKWKKPDYDYTKGFRIYRKSITERGWVRLVKNESRINEDSFVDRNVKKGETYYYTIVLINTAGLAGPHGKLLLIPIK